MAALQLEIVTPDSTPFEGRVAQVTLPGSVGEMGVLPGHLPLMSMLKEGVVIASVEGADRYFAVGAGFVEVLPDRVLVLVDDCKGAEDVDASAARAELAELEARLDKSSFKSDRELREVSAAAARARARVSIVERATKG